MLTPTCHLRFSVFLVPERTNSGTNGIVIFFGSPLFVEDMITWTNLILNVQYGILWSIWLVTKNIFFTFFQRTHNMSEYGLHLVCTHTKKKESKETNIIPTAHVND